MKRIRVYVQVKNQKTGRWTNYQSFKTYEEAAESLTELKETYPNAALRILDNNLVTHSK